MEPLEERTLLDGGGATQQPPPTWKPTSSDLHDVKNGPMANAGQDLISIYFEYQTYQQNGAQGPFVSSKSKLIEFQGSNVGIDVRGYGNLTTFQASLRNLGMQIKAFDARTGTVEGLVPIAQLPAVSALTGTVGVNPVYLPTTRSVGSATDQGERTLHADVARQTYNVDGTGVNVGVLSDSVSQFAGGLADSVKSGDLPSNVFIPTDPTTGQPEDGPAGSTDEGRAMLEQVHDIAPGAGLAFATAEGGDVAFANHIRDLATKAQSKIIVDDIGYFDEPFFQDGIISQAINDVTTNNGVTYLSAAGNSSDSGYSSIFRGVTANVAGVGNGRFMNFDPGTGVTTNLPVTFNFPGVIDFQWDNPFYTTTGVTSDLDIFVLDANNNVVASGTTNNIASQMPEELINIPTAGSYTVAIQVKSGPDPGRVEFLDPSSDDFTVSRQFGAAGGTFYPSTYGHPTADNAIGVGAVPWWNAPPWTNPSPVTSEMFSSTGPAVYLFNADGTRRAQPETRLAPDVSSPDGNDTSFFVPGQLLSTKNPPPDTGPATSTELDGNTLPNFFGTSSAAPNLAAVGALLKQFNSSLKSSDLRAAFIASATPLNGAAPGTWDAKGGFGLVDATKAIAAVDTLRVVSSTPASNATLSTSPSVLTFTFSKAVNPATLAATELVFTSTPPGVTVTVTGKPFFPNPADPKTVAFPINISSAANAKANGAYAFKLQGPIVSTDGKQLVPFSSSFNLQDTVAPRVIGKVINGRIIVINFSEAMRPSTIDRTTVYVIRTGSAGVFGAPTNVILNSDPRMVVFYDSTQNRAIIDLSQLDQTELPTDHYAVVVLDSATDQVGNHLDGEFNGVYPSGNGVEGGNFNLDLPNQQLVAPQITLLELAPQSDTGIAGDGNTSITRPFVFGRVQNQFPGTAAGLTVVLQFNGLNGGVLDLGLGAGGRGFSGQVNQSYAVTTTDSDGFFLVQAPGNLPNGFNRVRVVAIGQADSPPLPGFSSLRQFAFRVDTTNPIVLSPSIPAGTRINSLPSLSLNVADPVLPSSTTDPLAVPTGLSVPALNPQTADNISNYALINTGPDQTLGTGDDTDFSGFIVSANFVSTTVRANTNDPYTGRIDLAFAPGLPSGKYVFIVKTSANGTSGVTDAAGNPLDGDPSQPGIQNYSLVLNLQPEPTFVTSFMVLSPTPSPSGTPFSAYGPRSFFEIPKFGTDPRAPAPPTAIVIDFSNPLDPTRSYNDAVQLIRSADTAASPADGNFGVNGTSGFTRIAGTSVTLMNSIPGAVFGQPGYLNRLVLNIPTGTTLPPDYYRVYLPNKGPTAILDLFGNQLDGEFLGNPTTAGSTPLPGVTPAPEPPLQYEDLLPNGQYRAGLSGDGVPGGAFETGFVVVPNGNVIYAKPDYVDNPFIDTDDPDGSPQKPFPALAPEAPPGSNGGDLNSANNFANFDTEFDRNGNGHFDRSAFYAAQVASAKGPAVVVALPGDVTASGQKTFVLQAPAGTDPVANDGSGSVPFDTTLLMAPGSSIKFLNASLLVQNQGSALEVLGGANPDTLVHFTSLNDDSVGGPSRPPGVSTPPRGGDWGGVLFRNFDQTGRTNLVFPVDTTLQGPNGTPAVSGADDAMSMINFANVTFAGGAVPQTIGFRYDAITSFNSRPLLSNIDITQTGSAQGSQAAISGDLNAFREDDLRRGMLVRHAIMIDNSVNGILIRAEPTGNIEPTDALRLQNNPTSLGGAQNYTLDSPYPYVLLARMVIGQIEQEDTGGQESTFTDRLYVQPGMVLKSIAGAGIEVTTPGASINIGDRTYINEFDANPSISPLAPSFRPPTVGDANVLLTSFFDDNASTFFHDPNTGVDTQIVAPLDTDNGGAVLVPTPGKVDPRVRWGGVTVYGGARAVIDEATFQFGGGPLNNPQGTDKLRPVLSLKARSSNLGSHVFITNNNFFDNLDAAIGADPNSLLAADPLRPLTSGHPFFRGNVMQRNTYDGLRIYAFPSIDTISSPFPSGISEAIPGQNTIDQTVSTVWDSTDLTYVLRGSIGLGGGFFGFGRPDPNPNALGPELKPSITLTIQSALPGTLLANGQTIPRPGESVLVKLLKFFDAPGDGVAGTIANGDAGAGFTVGVDNGIDPTADPFVDQGLDGQIRILGIPGNETTGQQRIPAVITSLVDSTYGKTVRGVNMFNIYHPTDPNFDPNGFNSDGTVRTVPQAGDGGLIDFGAFSLTDWNMLDPRDGSLIDNADIRYMTRIELQGGGLADVYDANGDKSFSNLDDPRAQFLGLKPFTDGTSGADPLTQFNQEHAITISNSNLFDFSQVGVLAHPGFNEVGIDVGPLGGFPPLPPPQPFRTSFAGNPVALFMVNSSIANTPTAVRFSSDTGAGITGPNQDSFQDPYTIVLLHSTFNNDDTVVSTTAPPGQVNPDNTFSSVRLLAMDNIFANSSVEAITMVGQPQGSQLQYNLFWQNKSNLSVSNTGIIIIPLGGFGGNNGPIVGDPRFRDPATGDFTLLPNSAAIDAGRSEIGPNYWGNILEPAATQTLNASSGIRNGTGRLGGYTDFLPIPGNDLVTLPGSGTRAFTDEWVAALPGTAGAVPGAASNAATFNYAPITGERDQRGFQRLDDPSTPNTGVGSKPFFDVGAFEFRRLFPPHVVPDAASGRGVTAILADPTSPTGTSTVDLYSVGSIAGSNKTPLLIQFQFDESLDPTTINGQTIQLIASGSDGIFGNSNDKVIDLSGKLFYDPIKHIVSINTNGLNLGNDEYRIILSGNGGNVIRDTSGNALDGENTQNDDPNNPQLALPSGDGFPGGNFFLTFTIDTHPPAVVPGSVTLDPASDSGARDGITDTNHPSFSGMITDIFPPVNPGAGQTVVVDVSTKGDGVFDRLNAGTATTKPVFDAKGNLVPNLGQFTVTVSGAPLQDSPYKVGSDGKLSLFDALLTGYSIARIRVIDQAGNQSNPNDVNALTHFIVDTQGPRVTSATPQPNTQATLNGQGQLVIKATVNENLDPASVNSNTVEVFRSGGDGVFGNNNDVAISPQSITLSPPQPFTGAETITVVIGGSLPNDLYELKLVGGSSSNSVTDIAANPIDGDFSGVFPSGDGKPGGDFNLPFVIFNPVNTKRIFVGPDFVTNPSQPAGSRANPFPTIAAGINAAQIGDIVAVLPGFYNEAVTLKSLVRVVSADPSSSATSLVPGNALQTVIKAPVPTTGQSVTVQGSNLISVGTLDTELSGFTVESPLNGSQANGPILAQSVGINLFNSDVLVDKNYVVDSFYGIVAATQGKNAATPRIQDDGIIGNVYGLVLSDTGGTQSLRTPFQVINNTIAFNTTGIFIADASSGVNGMADIANNIFAQNNDLSAAHTGAAIIALQPDKTLVRFNLFGPGNGPSPGTQTSNIGAGFDPTKLSASQPDMLGNIAGNPVFTSPRDPRPNADGPAVFFTDASFDLQGTSAAIDNGLQAIAPALDFLSRGRVDIAGKGFPGHGPADIGAFEYKGSSSTASILAASLATGNLGSSTIRAQSTSSTLGASSIIVAFSQPVDTASVSPTDLLLSGSGVDNLNPARATSLNWVDDHTVDFILSGAFRPTGTVRVDIPAGAIQSTTGTPLPGFTETLTLGSDQGPATGSGSLLSGSSVATPPVLSVPVGATPVATPTATIKPAPVPTTPPPAPSPLVVPKSHVAPLAAALHHAAPVHHTTTANHHPNGQKSSGLRGLLAALRGRASRRKA